MESFRNVLARRTKRAERKDQDAIRHNSLGPLILLTFETPEEGTFPGRRFQKSLPFDG